MSMNAINIIENGLPNTCFFFFFIENESIYISMFRKKAKTKKLHHFVCWRSS
jgi:hypothetical protein